VDIAASRLVDRFSCYSPSVSPDGQYVAMLYLVARSASENRPSGAGTDDDIDVGFALYPADIGNREADNVDVPPSEAHTLVSYYVWQGSNEFFFADNRAGQIRVVSAEIRYATAVVRDLLVPPQQTETVKQYLTRQGFLSMKLAGGALQLTINSNPKRPVVIGLSLSDFEVVESVDLARKPGGSL